MAYDFDYGTLNWVKSEIDETLKQARTSLEVYVDNTDDETQLRFCINYLHQVNGTLQMVELYGASLVAEEMEVLAQELVEGKIGQREDAYEALMRGIIQLPDYLDRLQAGQRDMPIVLLPLLNDLRAARGAALLSENALFNPDLAVEVPLGTPVDGAGPDTGDMRQLARRLRHDYHLGLLGWFRDRDREASLQKIRDVIDRLREAAGEQDSARLLWVAGGVIEALHDGGLESSVAVKRLVGQVDRQIKQIIDAGESSMVEAPPRELLKNLLYYVAQADSTGERVTALKQDFQLASLLPDAGVVDQSRDQLSGPNSALLDTVSKVIIEDLTQVKDNLDLFVRGTAREVKQLKPLSDTLAQMADTLAMLGLGVQRKTIQDQVSVLDQMHRGERAPDDDALMDVAGALLGIEASLHNMGNIAPTDTIPEFRQVMGQTIVEIKAELSRIKESVAQYSTGTGAAQDLEEVPGLLNNIRGSLTLLDMARAAELVDNCRVYVERELLSADNAPEPAELDSLADAITSIEYYLESIDERWGNPSAILEVAAQSLEQLAKAGSLDPVQVASTRSSTVTGSPDTPSVDDTQTLVMADLPDSAPVPEGAAPSAEEASPYADAPTEEIQILAFEDVPVDTWDDDISTGHVAQRLRAALEAWFGRPTDDGATQVLREAIGAIVQATDTGDSTQAGKIGNDMDAMVVHIAAGQDVLNEDVRNTLTWAQDSLIQQHATVSGRDLDPVTAGPQAPGEDVERMPTNAVYSPTVPATETHIEGASDVSEPGAQTGLADVPSTAEVVPAPVAPTPQSGTRARHPVPEEIDDEIIAIFMEEAEEELANIGRLYPHWRDNVQDTESLRDLRRSFHTLKGSGRLVGAVDVGEFAWAFESLLNRVIDTLIEPTDRLMNLLQRAYETLPGLLVLFTQGGSPGAEVFALMEQAEALSQGREPAGMGGDPQEEMQGDATPAVPVDASVASDAQGVADNGQITDPESIVGTTAEMSGKSPVQVADEVGQRVPEIDPVLLDIYRNEVNGHRDTVRAFIAGCRKEQAACQASDELIRALHTLCGSSRTADIAPLAELGRALEYFSRLLQEKGLNIGAEGLSVLEAGMAYIDEVMAMLDEPGGLLPDQTALCQRIAALHAEAQAESAPAHTDAGPGVSSEPGGSAPSGDTVSVPEYDEELLEIFLEEGEEILDTSDNLLQQWIASPDQSGLVENMQRELHTLKGGARMVGIIEIGDLSHKLESLLTAVADGHVATSKRMFDVLQLAQDRLAHMLEDVRDHAVSARADDLIVAIDELLPGGARARVAQGRIVAPDAVDTIAEPPSSPPVPTVDVSTSSVAPLTEEKDPATDGQGSAWQDPAAGYVPGTGMGQTPTPTPPDDQPVGDHHETPVAATPLPTEVEDTQPPGAQDHELASRHSDTPVVAAPLAMRDDTVLSELSEEEEQARERRKGPRIQQEQIRVRADLLDNLVNFAGEVSIYRSRLEQQVNSFRYNLTEFDDTVARLREQLRQFEIATEAQIQYRYEEASARGTEDFDPLEFDRFTHMQQLSRGMMESLGDLDSLKALLGNLTRESETLLVQQSRVNTELQEGLMRSRMVPFSRQAARLRRIVRQVAHELGKEVELVLTGAEHELDRTVLDRVMAPIEHMLRNAVAHGIEMPDARHDSGKRALGQITISLTREGSEVVIRVADDGAGIDLDAVRRKALERGRIQADSVLSEEDLLDLILESGFSTADVVTQISGRGVGMDVVSSEIKQLGGSLAIDTRKGKGTLFSVRLPLTLSVTRALMVTAGEETYAVPLLSIEGIERVSHEELQRLYAADKPVYQWLGQDYAFLHMGQTLSGGEPTLPGAGRKAPVLITRSGDHLAALHVDGLIGSREVVVKPVGPQLSHLRGVSGATIMGDGTVALILDLGVLIRLGTVYEETPQVTATAQLPTVMVVDDSITVRKVTSRLLERHNIQVLTAKDGVDALALLQEQVPDVLLLDIEMPRMDGYELATNMRNDERLKHIPIIMITSRTGEKHRDRAMLIGVNRYMGKPFQEHDLLANIQALLAGDA